jgi:hypothetical protein
VKAALNNRERMIKKSCQAIDKLCQGEFQKEEVFFIKGGNPTKEIQS